MLGFESLFAFMANSGLPARFSRTAEDEVEVGFESHPKHFKEQLHNGEQGLNKGLFRGWCNACSEKGRGHLQECGCEKLEPTWGSL